MANTYTIGGGNKKVSSTGNPSGSSGGYTGGGYGYGGGGGGGGSSTDTTTTTYDTTDVVKNNRTDTTSADTGKQDNLTATYASQIDALQKAQDAANENYLDTLYANQNIADNSRLNADRQANDSWYISQQKQQNVSQAQNASNGTGNYGSAGDTLNRLNKLYDDIADQDILNNRRDALSNIFATQYAADQEATSDYRANLATQLQNLNDLYNDFVSQYGDTTGNVTKTTGEVKTKTTGSTTATSTTNSSGNSSTTNVKNTGGTTTENTGGFNTETTTNRNPFVTGTGKDARIDWTKVSEHFGIPDLSNLFSDVSVTPNLERTPVSTRGNKSIQKSLADLYGSNNNANTNLANSMRYGG